MVLTSVIRQTAVKRIPLIKFRRQRDEEAAAARIGSLHSGDLKGKSSSSPASVCLLHVWKNVIIDIDTFHCIKSTVYLLTKTLSNFSSIFVSRLAYLPLKIGNYLTDIVENLWMPWKSNISTEVVQLESWIIVKPYIIRCRVWNFPTAKRNERKTPPKKIKILLVSSLHRCFSSDFVWFLSSLMFITDFGNETANSCNNLAANIKAYT